MEDDADDGDGVQEGSGRSERGSDGSGGAPEGGVGICAGARGLASHPEQDVGLRLSGAGGRASRAHVRGGPRYVLHPLEQVSISGWHFCKLPRLRVGLDCLTPFISDRNFTIRALHIPHVFWVVLSQPKMD